MYDALADSIRFVKHSLNGEHDVLSGDESDLVLRVHCAGFILHLAPLFLS